MTKRIQKAIDIFLDAINEGTLAKGSCCACAVGNLVTHGMSGSLHRLKCGAITSNVGSSYWTNLFHTINDHQVFNPLAFHLDQAIANVKVTDFTLNELVSIEYAFECNTEIVQGLYDYTPKEMIRADQIKGLEAVIKVMLEFDECQDDIREIFTEKAELITI